MFSSAECILAIYRSSRECEISVKLVPETFRCFFVLLMDATTSLPLLINVYNSLQKSSVYTTSFHTSFEMHATSRCHATHNPPLSPLSSTTRRRAKCDEMTCHCTASSDLPLEQHRTLQCTHKFVFKLP